MSIWAPINIIVAVTIGGLFFGEWQGLGADLAVLRVFALCLLVAGLLVIVGWSGKAAATSRGRWSRGIACALGAGVLWGLYLVPIQQAGIPARLSLLPMACGMFLVSASFLFFRRAGFSSFPTQFAWLWLCGSGLLWGLGNVACLLLIERIGVGAAFALCQAALAINALAGVFVLRDRSATFTPPRRLLTGCGLVLSGGALVGTTLK
jgi:glucose uptake protein